MKFRSAWSADMDDAGTILGFEPTLTLSLTAHDGRPKRWTFIIDSGAEFSMAPRRLCDVLGIPWEDGVPIRLRGISPIEECEVEGRVHEIEVFIRQVNQSLTIPIGFAAGETPSLLGRQVFFDAFRIEFDQPYRTTTFEYLLDESE